ncbi:hypothetical protein HYV81_04830 [Candidatus Woesearchaeota archaeon]|nr:hypothetical protein [Candidatus Woesearchaeota archaeon]
MNKIVIAAFLLAVIALVGCEQTLEDEGITEDNDTTASGTDTVGGTADTGTTGMGDATGDATDGVIY